MYEFCKKTGHNLEYPYVDENEDHLKDPVQLKDICLEELICQINDYIDNKNQTHDVTKETSSLHKSDKLNLNNGKPGQGEMEMEIKRKRENSQSNGKNMTRKSSNKSSNTATRRVSIQKYTRQGERIVNKNKHLRYINLTNST